MGACLSKKKGSALNAVSTAPVSQLKNSGNGVTVTLSKPTNPELNLKKTTQEKQQQEDQVAAKGQNQVKKEIFIIKHRKSHDESREKSPKIQPCNAQQNKSPHSDDGLPSKIAPSTPNIGVVGVRTSSCTKEEVDAILIQCGRLSRSSSGRAASSSAGGGRKYSGSKRSFDFDHCDNDANFSADDDQRRANAVSATDNSDLCEDYDGVGGEKRRHQHRERRRQSPRPSPSRRRTPSRERDQQHQRSSSRERRVSRSPGRRSSETNSSANGATANAANSGNNSSSNNNNNAGSRPGKMVSVPATVSSLVMDKSNNGGGESGIKRISVKRNVGECGVGGSRGSASPRSQSPARGNGNAANAKVVCDNHHHHQQQQPSLSRNNSARKAEQSPCRRNALSEIDPNSLAYPQSNTNDGSSKVQNRPKKEVEAESNQEPHALEKDLIVNCKTKEQIEEEIRVMASMNDNHNVVVKTMVPSGVENLKPQNLTRSRSSRKSRDLDLNPEYESLLNNPTQSYTSLLLEDIQNFHQKNTQQPSISLPACLSKACSILEAVADLNSTTSSNFSGLPSYRNEHNNASSFGSNNHHYGKNKVTENNTKDPFVESEVHVFDDVMEPSLHKYVTVKRGGSVCRVVDSNNMEDQESSGSNSFFTQQNHFSISSNTWEANSADSTDSWTSRLMEGSDAVAEARKALSCKKRECDDHQHSSGIGRGRLNGSSSSSNNKCSSINIEL